MINFTEKAQELSHALIRLAVYIRRKDFRQRIESSAFDLIETISRREYEQAVSTIESLTGFIKLGAALYEIETLNSRILLGELSLLNAAVRQSFGLDQVSDVSVLFSSPKNEDLPKSPKTKYAPVDFKDTFKPEFLAIKSVELENSAIGNNKAIQSQESEQFGNSAIYNTAIPDSIEIEKIVEAIPSNKEGFKYPDANMIIIGSTIRQNSILDKIKEMSKKDSSGYVTGCRMKDLLAAFSEVSERTLRYDLQKLVGRGLIERMGNGGPSSVYVMK